MYFPMYAIIFILIFVALFIAALLYLTFHQGMRRMDHIWQEKLPDLEAKTRQRSKSIIRGQIAEQFAPYLPGFPFQASDCHFLGKPIDFVVFDQNDKYPDGMAIILVEIKTGQSQLTAKEKMIKQAATNKQIFWYEYRLDLP